MQIVRASSCSALGKKLSDNRITSKKMHRVGVHGKKTRYQRRVENAQQEHAKEVAEHLVQIVRETGLRRSLSREIPKPFRLLMEQLPQDIRGMWWWSRRSRTRF